MMLTSAGQSAASRRPSLVLMTPPSIVPEYSDSRTHAAPGPSRHVRLPRATAYGGGSIAKSEDGTRCAVAGKDSLRILRITDSSSNTGIASEHRTAVGSGGYRIEASRNLWGGGGLKIDSAFTDVTWAHGPHSNKILTSSRNGELIMWDLQKAGPSKYERRARDHVRSIHQLACSTISKDYCLTGSADGDLRVWDLRDLSKSIMRIYHPTSVRALALSPVSWQPLQAIVGLDNGSIYRWDLTMGQRGLLDRIPVAHSKAIIALDWSLPHSTFGARTAPTSSTQTSSAWYGGMGAGLFDDLGSFGGSGSTTGGPGGPSSTIDGESSSMGWLASGGLDRCVKVWDLTAPSQDSHMSRTPAHTLHTSYPVRRVLWRPGPAYECELAVVSNVEFGTSTGAAESASPPAVLSPNAGAEPLPTEVSDAISNPEVKPGKGEVGDPIEIWDVRRGYIAKWSVRGSAVDGGVTDMVFRDPHSLWAQHSSGSFSQFDLRQMLKPIDAIPRVAATWDVTGSLVFVADKPRRWEVPYDEVHPEKRQIVLERKGKLKALGDKPHVPTSQTIGTFLETDLVPDVEAFAKLARSYIFEGADRKEICNHNAEVAMEAGKKDAAQAWLLLHSLLCDLSSAPTSQSLSPLPLVPPQLSHSNSAPAAVPTAGHPSAAIALPLRSVSADNNIQSRNSSESPASSSRQSSEKFSAPNSVAGYLTPQRVTPSSSNASSPHRPSSALPSVPTSVFARRGSNPGLSSLSPMGPTPQKRPRLFSSHSYINGRKPSFLYGPQSSSPTDGSIRSGSGSLKHVGDGALSDSDDEDEGTGRVGGSEADSDEEPHNLQESYYPDKGNTYGHTSLPELPGTFRSSVSPYLYPRTSAISTHAHTHPNPSPLSRVAGQQVWTDDEGDKDGEDSPSPASSSNSDYGLSDEEGSMLDSKGKRVKLARRSSKSARHRARSRSSTVASLAVSQPTPRPPTSSLAIQTPKLTKQDSQSSIRTVTASTSPYTEEMKETFGLHRDDTIRDLASYSLGRPGSVLPSSYLQHKRIKSAISAEFSVNDVRESRRSSLEKPQESVVSKQRSTVMSKGIVEAIEARIREVGWEALRETLDIFADEGDVQMCTLLSLVAGEELKVNVSRLVRFLESYIDLLVRLRLHTSATYMRKFAPVQEVRNTTALETTIYTSCGRCFKPMLIPSARTILTTTPTDAPLDHRAKFSLEIKPPPKPAGKYAFCLSCRETASRCSICHLPVRALLFKCTVCMHGGHQECYQMYYLRRPMVDLKSQQPLAASPQAPTIVPQSLSAPPLHSKPSARGRTPSGIGDSVSDDGINPSTKDTTSEIGDSARTSSGDVNASGLPISLVGHPCAAGCGHYCWAASGALYSRSSD